MTACTADLLIGTLPGMVQTPLPRASPEPAATSAMTRKPDEGTKQRVNSPNASHCVRDTCLGESQATENENSNVSAAKKGTLFDMG